MASTRTPAPPTTPAGGEKAARRGLLRRRAAKRTGPGRLAQIRDVYRMTVKVDPKARLWIALAAAGPFVVLLLIGIAVGHPVYLGLIGLMLGLLGGLIVLTRRAERAAYSQIEGVPGAAGQALKTLRRGWTVSEEPVAVDPRTRDTVFRAVGRPGVVLVSDGPVPRVERMLEAERRKVARLLPDVPLHVVRSGRGQGQVPIAKLPRHLMRLKPTLSKPEITAVLKRLRAMGGMRLPMPKGVDPMRARPDRRATRGR